MGHPSASVLGHGSSVILKQRLFQPIDLNSIRITPLRSFLSEEWTLGGRTKCSDLPVGIEPYGRVAFYTHMIMAKFQIGIIYYIARDMLLKEPR